ncbi:MAG: hypothetical protein LBK72_08430 [Bifidobacteriaceae bacterium]|nr:hypothetical protein [Bifidobacteriaceae bacterium]
MLFRIACDCEFDGTGQLVRIVDVDTIDFFAASNTPWGERLVELSELASGWLDGGGAQVSLDAIEFARDLVAVLDESGLPAPRIYPTEPGGVQLEWHAETGDTEVEIGPDLVTAAFHFGAREESLEDVRGVVPLVDFVRRHL